MCQVKALKLHKKCSTPLEPFILYIVKDKETLGICLKCWNRISDGGWEIGDLPKPTMEEIFSDKMRFGENPIETDYKLKSLKKDVEPNEEF